MNLTLGIVTDLHFGPEARFGGKLRKLTSQAGALTAAFARRMRDEVRPDLVVSLGDVLEDESPAADRTRYAECMRLLAESGRERLDVAGNHDVVNLTSAELRAFWGLDADGPLYRSLDRGGVHLVTLYTHETKDVDVTIDDAQLDWLARDLAANELPVVVLMHHSASEQLLVDNRWFGKAPHIALVKQRKALRGLFESGRVVLVVNGHVHWNHLDVIAGIPYVTVQSLIENVEDDAPGRPAAAHAVVRIGPRRVSVDVAGAEVCRYQFEL
jgi:3',5'-cyclic-AMP phosphodiesterase